MKAVIERITQHPKTTIGGVGLAAIFYYVMNSWQCQLPSGGAGWLAWGVVAGPIVLGMLSRDK